ncbi:hypothetical protein WH47_07841 [Habropoda laboriosa]|uniref:Mos1 transposase HTH domain-containing protein n=1 Tax=Habropoda laboriosa TaxID=597456 RepID=A0A0L7QPB8_9HYME|nr:hypothetical protein WH47_07841 [Habropoda laboriosa]
MGKVQKCGAWVPHALSDNNKNQRATISVGCQIFHFSIWHTNHERFFLKIKNFCNFRGNKVSKHVGIWTERLWSGSRS